MTAPVTPADRAKGLWDAKLRQQGHRLNWQQQGTSPGEYWRGACEICGGSIECGDGRLAAARLGGRCLS